MNFRYFAYISRYSKDNQKSYYIKSDEWGEYLAEAVEMVIRPASAEIFGGTLKPSQVSQRLQEKELIDFAENLLLLTYEYQPKELAKMIDNYLSQLPGGEDWFE